MPPEYLDSTEKLRLVMPSRQTAGIVVATLVGLCYGISLVVARMSYDHGTGVVTIAVLRYGILCVLLGCWLRFFGGGVSTPRGLGWRSMGVGVLAVTTALGYLGTIKFIPVSLGTLVFYTNPLFTVLLASAFAGERSTWIEVGATVVALVGLMAVLEVSFESLHPLGILLGTLASVAAAIVFVLSAKVMTSIDPFRFTFFMALGATLFASMGFVFAGAAGVPDTTTGLALLASAVLLNVVGLLGMFVSIRLIGPVATPMMLNIEPVTAIVFAMLLLDEHMTPFQMAGAGLVMVMVMVAQASRSTRSAKAV